MNGDLASSELYTAVSEGLVLSQTGLTFRAVADGTVEKSAIMLKRKASEPNPYVVGNDMVVRYYAATLAMLHASILYRQAHPNDNPPATRTP